MKPIASDNIRPPLLNSRLLPDKLAGVEGDYHYSCLILRGRRGDLLKWFHQLITTIEFKDDSICHN